MATVDDSALLVPSHRQRVIVHIDLDAFYCQVERRRLNLDPSLPMAVQQWQGLIAVNYPARAAGISRHDRVDDARRKCPQLLLVHVETLDSEGKARENAVREADKVSLARYRNASAEIFRVLLRIVGEKAVEKASVDEAYLDVSVLVDAFIDTGCIAEAGGRKSRFVPTTASLLLSALPASGVAAEAATASVGGSDDCELSRVTTPAARVAAIINEGARHAGWHVIASDGKEIPHTGDDYITLLRAALSPDRQSDVRIAAGAIVAAYIRECIFLELTFSCSCGIACNKMLAKLGSARNKPSKQTLVPMASIPALMERLPLQKIRFLGGKLGVALSDEVLRCRSTLAAADAATAAAAAAADARMDDDDDDGRDRDDADDEQREGDDDDVDLVTGSRTSLATVAPAPPAAVPSTMQVAPDAASVPPPTAGEAQRLPLPRLRALFDDGTAMWLYRIVRGVDDSDITPRTKPKGMMAAKSFDPSTCNSLEGAVKWLRMLSAELAQRLLDDEAQWHRSPRTLVLHYRRVDQRREGGKSRSCPMPPKPRSMEVLLAAATALYKRAMEEEGASVDVTGRRLACTALTLSANNFVDYATAGEDGTRAITAFFKPAAAGEGSVGTISVPPRSVDEHTLLHHFASGKRTRDEASMVATCEATTEPAEVKREKRGTLTAAFARHHTPDVVVLDDDDDSAPHRSAAAAATPSCPSCCMVIALPGGVAPESERAHAIIYSHVDACLRKTAGGATAASSSGSSGKRPSGMLQRFLKSR